jgi:hypothetical protein
MNKEEKEMIALFIKVARHARNFPHPQIPIERLRREAVEAEQFAEGVMGRELYEKISEIAFADDAK